MLAGKRVCFFHFPLLVLKESITSGNMFVVSRGLGQMEEDESRLKGRRAVRFVGRREPSRPRNVAESGYDV